jgi:hypothetical protein
MFSHTKAKVDAESDQIVTVAVSASTELLILFCSASFKWMFQRYEIVVDYEQRLCLPPPLTIISYAIMLFERLQSILAKCVRQNPVEIFPLIIPSFSAIMDFRL